MSTPQSTLYYIICLCIEPIVTYIWMRRATRRYHKYSNSEKAESKFDRRPPKIICKHFDLKQSPLHIDIYLRYLLAYIFFIRMIVTYVVMFFTAFDELIATYMCFASLIIMFIWFIIYIIAYCLFVRKKPKNKSKAEKKKTMKEIFQEEISYYRRRYRILKGKEWKNHLNETIPRYLRQRNGEEYISMHFVNYCRDKVFPYYGNNIYYEIHKDSHTQKSLVIYEKKTNAVLWEILIK